MDEIFTKAIDILYLAKQQDVEIILNGDQLQLKVPKGKTIDKDLLKELGFNKQLIIDYLGNNNLRSTIASNGNYEINQFNRDEVKYIPLSFSQERLWFVDRLEGSVQYHIPAVLRLKGELNRKALEDTLRTIINRHEVLRTVIREYNDQGYQHIMSAEDWTLGSIKEPGINGKKNGELSSYIAELIGRPFDLSADYMLRADLMQLSKDEYFLVVTMHHIASDAWSTSILVKEVIGLYNAFAGNLEIDLPEPPIQYADYALWQKQHLQGKVLEDMLGYWKSKLEDVAPLQLPTDYGRPLVPSSRGAVQVIKIDKQIATDIADLSRRQGTTQYMTLLAAFNVLLYRYSGQEDICVGTPIVGRNRRELEGLIGFFVNTLALRSRVRGEMPFIELLQEVKETTLEAYDNQEIPFEKIVDAVVKDRDLSRSPLFQVLFKLQNEAEKPRLKLGDMHLTLESQEQTTAKFELTFSIAESKDGFTGTVQYNTDLFRADRIARMIDHFRELLISIVSAPETAVGCLPMLGPGEREQLLVNGRSNFPSPETSTIADLFEAQALCFPNCEAVIFAGQTLSYEELNRRANVLGNELQRLGIKEDTLVPLYTSRGIEMLIGILGILKAGGAYVPIDTNFPTDRITYMLEDTGAKVVVSSKQYSGQILSACGVSMEVLEADGLEAGTGKQP